MDGYNCSVILYYAAFGRRKIVICLVCGEISPNTAEMEIT
jgi:hypothetical protein